MSSADQERLDEALERAAEMLDAHKAMPYEPPPHFGTCAVRGSGGYWWAVPEQALEGWAEAVKALREAQKARLATDDWQRKCVKQAHGDSHMRCGECFLCLERKAISKLCDMMLGGSS